MEEVGRADLGGGDRMVLLAPTHDFHPGELVRGVVELNLARTPCIVRGAWIKLAGTATATAKPEVLTEGAMAPPLSSTVQLLREDEEFHNGGVTETFVGFGEQVDDREADMVELSESSYSWPFVFKLPTNCPFSYCDDHVEVSYSLTAVLDAPIVPLSVATLQHTLVVGALTSAALEAVGAPEAVLGYAHMQAPLSARAVEAGDGPAAATAAGAGAGEQPSLLSRWWRSLFPPTPQPHVTLQLPHPAIFTYTDSTCNLGVKTLVRHLPRRCTHVLVRYRVVLEVLVRDNEFVPWEVTRTEWTNDAEQGAQSRKENKRRRRKLGSSAASGQCTQHMTTLWRTDKRVRLAPIHGQEGGAELEVRSEQEGRMSAVPVDCMPCMPCALSPAN